MLSRTYHIQFREHLRNITIFNGVHWADRLIHPNRHFLLSRNSGSRHADHRYERSRCPHRSRPVGCGRGLLGRDSPTEEHRDQGSVHDHRPQFQLRDPRGAYGKRRASNVDPRYHFADPHAGILRPARVPLRGSSRRAVVSGSPSSTSRGLGGTVLLGGRWHLWRTSRRARLRARRDALGRSSSRSPW